MRIYYARIITIGDNLNFETFTHTFRQYFGYRDIYGTSGADRLFGSNFADRIHAKEGNDVIVSGMGNDSVFGGDGDDVIRDAPDGVISTGSGADLFHGGMGNDWLSGNSGNDTLSGDEGNDQLYGGDGWDVLLGGTGADQMRGGTGNDVYHVDNIGDTVNEAAGGGEDTVTTRINYTLGANVEHLAIDATITFGLTVTGNALNNGLSGGRFGDVMHDGDSNDKVCGLDGDDDLNGGAGEDLVEGGMGRDRINGGAGLDFLDGGKDADVFVFSGSEVTTAAIIGGDKIMSGSGGVAFEIGLDKIDLSGIDAKQTFGNGGDQGFTFGGFWSIGSLQISDQNGMTQIIGNVDLDRDAECGTLIDDGAVSHTAYTASDFIL